MWYAYFLKLGNDGVYVGWTKDLRARIDVHRSGHVTSTRNLQPAHLLSYVAVASEQTARALEKYFKSGSGKAFANKRFWPHSNSSGTA